MYVGLRKLYINTVAGIYCSTVVENTPQKVSLSPETTKL